MLLTTSMRCTRITECSAVGMIQSPAWCILTCPRCSGTLTPLRVAMLSGISLRFLIWSPVSLSGFPTPLLLDLLPQEGIHVMTTVLSDGPFKIEWRGGHTFNVFALDSAVNVFSAGYGLSDSEITGE